jgi:hypothetical protein
MLYYKMPKYTKAQKAAFAKRMRNKKTRVKRKPSKRQMISARAPIVECKKKSWGVVNGTLGTDIVFHSFPCRSFLQMKQGLNEDEFIGNSVFSKYYSMKVKLNFPTEFPINNNFRAQLVWGWMTMPLGYTEQVPDPLTDPGRNTVSRQEIDLEIIRRTENGFDQAQDQMKFRQREKTIYRIEGKKWVQPDRRHQIGANQTSSTFWNDSTGKAEITHIGSVPPFTHQCQFKPMRKIRLSETSSNVPAPPTYTAPYHYPNESWVPFVALYTPNNASYYTDASGEVPLGAKISFQTNDCHWYTDG